MAITISDDSAPPCQKWRTSSAFIIFTAILALFTESFLYTFIVPILSYMIEVRLSLPPSATQRNTTGLLAIHGFVAMLSAPVIAHFTDKTPNRKTPLLLSLAGAVTGTTLLALTPGVLVMLLGRILQAVASSAGWIVAFSTLTDNVPMEHLGKTLGLASSFVSAGVICGPAVSGPLLDLAGYWAAWAVPFTLLGVDLVARLIMLERVKPRFSGSDGEEESLLGSSEEPARREEETDKPPREIGFYRAVLCNLPGLVGLSNTFVFSMILTGLDSTLPLHLRNVFGWSSLRTGLIFLALQLPGTFLSPIVGALRDKVGLRIPTTTGWILVAVSLWVLGIPGHQGITWASPNNAGQAVVIGATVSLGLTTPLVRGVAMIQLMGTPLSSIQEKSTKMTGMLEAINSGSSYKPIGPSKVFSSLEIAFNLGSTAGPLLTGSVVEILGFYYTYCVLGMPSPFLSWMVLRFSDCCAFAWGAFVCGFEGFGEGDEELKSLDLG